MAAVESLEISIQSKADAAIDSLNKLIKQMGLVAEGINAIGKNSGLQEFSRKAQEVTKEFSGIQNAAKDVSSQFGNFGKAISQSMKPINDQAKKTSQSLEEISSRYADLGKGFQFFGTNAQAEKQLDKLNNKLQEALLKEEELGRSGETGGKKYEYAIRDIFKYTNQIESLKEQFKGLEIPASGMPHVEIADLSDEEFAKLVEGFQETQRSAQETSKAISEIGNAAQETAIKFSSEWPGIELPDLSEKFDLSKMTDQELDEWFNNLPAIREEAERTARAVDEIKMPEMAYTSVESMEFDAEAMSATFGEATKDIRNYTDAIERYGIQAGKVLNEGLSGSSNGIDELNAKLKQLKAPEIKEDNLSKLQSLLKKAEADLEKLRVKLANGLTMGNITESIDDKGFVRLRQQIVLTEKQAEALKAKIQDVGSSKTGWIDRIKNGFNDVSIASKRMSKSLSEIRKYLNKVGSGIGSLFSRFAGLGKIITGATDSNKKMNASMGASLKTILKYGFGIRSLYMLINKIRSAMKEGFGNLAQYSNEVNSSLTSMTSALFTTKNALAVAFAPILNVIAPYVTYLINLLNSALNAIGRFFSALTGKNFATQAVGVVKDFAAGISKSGGAAKNAAKDLNKYIAGWHEVNNMTTNEDSDSGGGSGGGISLGDMFTTVPIEDKMKSLADKIRDIFAKLFEPLKKAWEEAGVFVMNSWKYALSEIWELAKSIGRDFLTVWNQPETVAMLTDILYIIGDIGLSIGYLARNFRKAWEGGETGLHILENIRDIFATIIHNIALAADATVLWADKLNFSPILQAIERFTESLIPVANALSGVLTDFYTMVLLPLGKWTIEEGLPQLLDVFTAFNEKVDWESLRSNLQEFWTRLEPFAETVGEGLIVFIERVSELVAGFLNSEVFVDFLHAIEDWMDSVTPEDVADGIVKLAEAFVFLKLAAMGFSFLETISKSFLTLTTAGTQLGTMFSGLGTAISGLKMFLGTLSAPVLAIAAAFAALVVGLEITYATNEDVRRSFDAAIASIKEGLQPALEFITGTVLPNLRDGWKALKEILSPLGEFLSGMFTSIWQDMINPALTYIGENVLPKLTEAFENLWNKVLVPLASLLSDVLRPAIEIVSDVLTVLWKNIVIPLANAIGEILSKAFEGIVKIFNKNVIPIVNAVIEVFRFLWNETLSPIIDFLWDAFEPAFETVFETIGGIIENIGDAFGGLIEFVSGIFTRDWESAWDGVTGIFDGVKNTIKGIIDGIIGFIGDLIGGIRDAISGINRLESRMNSVSNRTVGGIVDIGLGAFGRQAFPFAALPDAEFPGYASGQVIPRNMRKHLAWLGDNNRETEVVSPLSTIKQAVAEAMKELGGYQPAPVEAHILPDYTAAKAYMDMNRDNPSGTWDDADERAAETDYRSQQMLEALEENNNLLSRILAQGIILDDNEFEQRYRRSATKFRRRTGGQLGVQF